jgi:hypothetical protein
MSSKKSEMQSGSQNSEAKFSLSREKEGTIARNIHTLQVGMEYSITAGRIHFNGKTGKRERAL